MINIAIVDDETEVFDLFKIRFKKDVRAGRFNFHFFEHGKQCYDFLKDHSEIKIIVVFSDINMPVMDGFSLLELIKKDFPGIDVFLVSAYDFKDKALQAGANGYISKPFDFKNITKFIENVVDEHFKNHPEDRE